MPDLHEALGAIRSQAEAKKEEPEHLTPLMLEARVEDLKARAAAYREPRNFKVGELVDQVPELTKYRYPESRQPGIIVELIPDAKINPDDSGDAKEREDVLVGLILSSGRFLTFPMASARLRYWVQE